MDMGGLIDPVNFLLATRDTGYKSTSLVVAEFLDNSIQAGARSVRVDVSPAADPRHHLEITVTDDGAGMDEDALGNALTFGGSSRFNDRSSLGRYGMGLPNGALSRARRVEVYSWQGPKILSSVLDLDEVARGGGRHPVRVLRDGAPFVLEGPAGTAVRLLRCDRVEYKRPSVLARKLAADLGRIYRYFLRDGLELTVNGKAVEPVDPMFMLRRQGLPAAREFGNGLVYKVDAGAGSGRISVKFSELPVDQWHDLSVSEKREMGVTNAPSVSVVRAGREIDRGWFFMGSKRRENYDDWWRCEVSFDPALDELFGVTHSKQAVTPSAELLGILAPDLEPIARALNGRVRRQFEMVRAVGPLSAAEKQAARADPALPPMPKRAGTIPEELRDLVDAKSASRPASEAPYLIMVTDLPVQSAFEVLVRKGRLVMLLNSRHPLYRDLYGPLAMSESGKDQAVAKQIALAVLAGARAEVTTPGGAVRAGNFRQTWADVLATFLNA